MRNSVNIVLTSSTHSAYICARVLIDRGRERGRERETSSSHARAHTRASQGSYMPSQSQTFALAPFRPITASQRPIVRKRVTVASRLSRVALATYIYEFPERRVCVCVLSQTKIQSDDTRACARSLWCSYTRGDQSKLGEGFCLISV